MSHKHVIVATQPFDGQKPGTSGLRKSTKVFMQENYTENFIQCTLLALGNKLRGSSLVVAGDGRYFLKEATHKIIKLCAGNGVSFILFYYYLKGFRTLPIACDKNFLGHP